MPKPLILCLFLLLSCPSSCWTQEKTNPWSNEVIPDTWKKTFEGTRWYRCGVEVPASWSGEALSIFVEGADDAREVFINGQSVGLLGTFPPEYRSGLGRSLRFAVPDGLIETGQVNVIALRIHQRQSRGNFNVAAPVLFAEQQAMRMAGQWQVEKEDNTQWSQLSKRKDLEPHNIFSKLQDAKEVEKALKRLELDPGAQTVASTVAQLSVPQDLTLEVAVAEPHVRQPLSMKWDAQGRLWVMQYLQYPEIAGLKMVSRDKYLRTVYDKVPEAPPHHVRGADVITIHEDTDGDGQYDKHKTFLDGLNLATSFAIGRGGVYVLNPPYLLFYPDRDQDDQPDGDPKVLLEGFGLEDSHSVANSLRWGPDGWLYSTQGSTVSGHIRRPGSQEEPVHSLGQLVWRYHPESARYEIFAEGGGNAFGVEFDSEGRVFSGHNGGDTRGFHYVQGGYYRKGFGKHGSLSNPYSYGYFPSMAHAKVPRFTHTFVIYEGNSLPEYYHGKLFGCGPLQGHVVFSDVRGDGSSFQTEDLGMAMESKDRWVRPVDIKAGPDGALYVADMYEQRIDHASHYQGRIHRESGRIYRLRGPKSQAAQQEDFTQASNARLLELLSHSNRWHRETALRVLADRREREIVQPLVSALAESEGVDALCRLWAINLSGGFSSEFAEQALTHPEALVREWTIRLLGDSGRITEAQQRQLVDLAMSEENPRVRSQLAATVRRLPIEAAVDILNAQLRRDDDADDIHIPLLLWWAIESHVTESPTRILSLFEDPKLWQHRLPNDHISQRLMRRLASSGQRFDLLHCATLLGNAPETQYRDLLLKGFEEAFQGQSLASLPDELLAGLARSGGGSLSLRLRQKQPAAITEALQLVANASAPATQRVELMQILADIQEPRGMKLMLGLLNPQQTTEVSSAALSALQAYSAPEIGNSLTQFLADLKDDNLQKRALSTLASRKTWTRQLLDAVEQKRIAAERVDQGTLRKMLLHQDPKLEEAVTKLWGVIASATTDQMITEMERIESIVSRGSGNPYTGKKLYEQQCGKCHRLFENGEHIGPDLTSYKRDDPRQMLANIVNPSLEIREGYENYVVLALDGRAITGFIEDQDNSVLVIKSADGQRTIIRKDDIDLLRASPKSLMPEGLLSKLSDQQLRDLFAYIRSSQPLP